MASFCDVPLLLPDADERLQALIDSALPIDELRLWGNQTHTEQSGRQRARGRDRSRIPLPIPNWPDPPPLKINTLYVPTGASRWSVGLFLVDADGLTAIYKNAAIDQSATGDVHGTLTLADGVGGTVSFTMYMLPPRPITAVANGQTYLLVLVDARYFWQFYDVGDLEITDSTTWANLFSSLESALNVTLSYTTDFADWGYPDPMELLRKYENAAALFDAAAASVGCRATYDSTSNTLTLQTPTEAQAVEQPTVDRLAGGESPYLPGVRPASVTTVFRRVADGLIDGEGALYTITVDADSVTTVDGSEVDQILVTDTTLTIFSAAGADFTDLGEYDPPDNESDLEDLATNIATSFYQWTEQQFDFSLIGMVAWVPTGYVDHVMYHCGLESYIRVVSLPPNFGVTGMLQQVLEIQYPNCCVFEWEYAGETAVANPTSFDAYIFLLTGEESTVTMHVWGGNNIGLLRPGAGSHAGTIGIAYWSDYYGYWCVAASNAIVSTFAKVKDATIAAGASGTITLWGLDYDPLSVTYGQIIDLGVDVTAWNWSGTGAIVGDCVEATLNQQEGVWFFRR